MVEFVCKNCNKAFNTNSHLKQHMNKKIPCSSAFVMNNEAMLADNSLQNIMNTYNTLILNLKQSSSINHELKQQNKQMYTEIKCLKLKLSSIHQIITAKHTTDSTDSTDSTDTHTDSTDTHTDIHTNSSTYHPDDLIYLPKKMVLQYKQ